MVETTREGGGGKMKLNNLDITIVRCVSSVVVCFFEMLKEKG